jgi:hypothetical protein
MPEWMDDDDSHLNNATFEQDGTFTRSSSVRQNNNDEQQQQQQKAQSQSTSEESLSQGKTVSIDFILFIFDHLLTYSRFQHNKKKKLNLKNQYNKWIQLLLMFQRHPNPLVNYFFNEFV